MQHQPHPGPTTPAWAVPSAEYLARHAQCDHAWGTCLVKVPCTGCASRGAIVAHYDNCELAQSDQG